MVVTDNVKGIVVPLVSAKTARSFFACALIVWGAQHMLFRDFIAGRAPAWPAHVAGQLVFAYLTGLLLILTGIAVLADKKARPLLVITGIVILLWAAIRNLIPIVMNLDYGGALTSTCKAFTFGTGAFLVASTVEPDNRFPSYNLTSALALSSRYAVGAFLLIGGIQHFIFVDFVKFLIPAWIPGATFWTYFTGVALGLSGLSLITGIKISLAATLAAWMIFVWVFALHLPRAIAESNQNEWTAVFEALAVSGILFLIARRRS